MSPSPDKLLNSVAARQSAAGLGAWRYAIVARSFDDSHRVTAYRENVGHSAGRF